MNQEIPSTLRTGQLNTKLACALAAMVLPFQVFADNHITPGFPFDQATCGSNIQMVADGEEPFFVNEQIPIILTLSANQILADQNPGVLHIEEFDYKPDCNPGQLFETCTSAGNNVIISSAPNEIVTTCQNEADAAVTFTYAPSGTDPAAITFTPSADIALDHPDESCTVEFDVEVVSVQQGTTVIVEASGWVEEQIACYVTVDDDGGPLTYQFPAEASTTSGAEIDFALSTERAEFRVTKDFIDDNAVEEVDVFISCNAGLPLRQSFTLGDEDHVTFIVKNFAAGSMDCRIWEEPVPGGYDASYVAGGTGFLTAPSVPYADETGCHFENVETGQFTCDVTNKLDEVEIKVTKEWIGVDETTLVDLDVTAEYTCYNVFTSPDDTTAGQVDGSLSFSGLKSSDVIDGIYPAPSGSYCEVFEPNVASYVEPDVSDCAKVPVAAGEECTIYNTVFYEGIPTLSQYGLALMALLMLGVGMVGFRRFA